MTRRIYWVALLAMTGCARAESQPSEQYGNPSRSWMLGFGGVARIDDDETGVSCYVAGRSNSTWMQCFPGMTTLRVKP